MKIFNRLNRYLNYVVVTTTSIILVSSPIAHAVTAPDLDYAANDIFFYNTSNQCTTVTTSKLTVDEKIPQLFIVGFDSNGESTASVIKKYKFGGAYFNNTQPSLDPAIVEDINKNLPTDAFFAADDEGGQVQRFLSGQPSAKEMGSMDTGSLTQHGADVGTKLKTAGVNVLLAPVLDIDVPGASNGISNIDRSFSSDPAVVSEKAGAFANGVASSKVGVVFKHFPGLSRATGNTDHVLQDLPGTIDDYNNDLIPYKNLKNSPSAMIMLANFRLSGWGPDPISTNENAVKYIRNTIGFMGPIVTDDIDAMSKYSTGAIATKDSVVKSLKAGVTLPLFRYTGDENMDATIEAVKNEVPESTIDAAFNLMVDYKKSIGLDTSRAFSVTTTGSTTPENTGSGGAMGSQYPNIEPALKYMTGTLGMTLAQASGMIGNMIQESSVRPDIIEGGATAPDNYQPVNGRGFGLVQWTFTSRQQPLVDLSQSTNRKITDLTLQFDYVKQELHTSYKSTTEAIVANPDFTAGQYAIIFHGKTGHFGAGDVGGNDEEANRIRAAINSAPALGYEASADNISGVMERVNDAQKVYDEFKGKISDGSGFGDGISTGGVSRLSQGLGCGGGGTQRVASTTCSATEPVRGAGSKGNTSQRTTAELAKLYGTADEIRANPKEYMTNVDFMGKSIEIHKDVAGCLQAVADEIKKNNINYVVREAGGRREFDGQIGDASYHIYGAAIDINPSTNPWRDFSPAPYDLPTGYRDAFHNHGWSWGGAWGGPYDYMHFEYNG